MASKNLVLPLIVSIGNSSKTHTRGFIPYKENFITYFTPGDVVEFGVGSSEEAEYYYGQAYKDIVVGVRQNNGLKVEVGDFDEESGHLVVKDTTYNIVADGTTLKVFGDIPCRTYESLGVSGNIVGFNLSMGIAKASLPSGTIVKQMKNGETKQSYTSSAFNDDGSLTVEQAVAKGNLYQYAVMWKQDEWTTYTIDITNATLLPKTE